MENKTTNEITRAFEKEIVSAKHEFKIRWVELVVTILSMAVGVTLFALDIVGLLSLSIILFGALWNFFTDSNRLFACIMAFLMCIVYGFLAGSLKVYGHAFLHIMFYLPTQLIYYYESQKSEDNSVRKDKKLTTAGYVGTVVSGWIMAFGLAIILYKIGDPFYIIDALSSTLLAVSVFLVNGKYKEYYPVRIAALVLALITWIVIAITVNFAGSAAIFILLFAMYIVMDIIEWIRWAKR